MLIDAHTHLWPGKDYLPALLRTCDDLGIERVCLSGLGAVFAMADNKAVAAAIQQYSQRLIGFYYIRLGCHQLMEVDMAVEQGFRGLKFTIPINAYDCETYFPVYEKAQSYRLPCLFHCGIVTTKQFIVGVSSAKMQPIHLEAIAREFPNLVCVCAHLGMPWYEEAVALARILPNIYVDISGAPGGWRAQKKADFFSDLFFWPGAWEKVVWASDVDYHSLPDALTRDRALENTLALSAEKRAAFEGDTIKFLLNIT